MLIREVRPTDWPAILALANRSVAGVPGAGTQEEWLRNRRSFDASRGTQRQFVAEEASRLVGYGALESDAARDAYAFRLFVVTDPVDLPSVGEFIYSQACAALAELNARHVWLTEYAADTHLLQFAAARGFRETRRFPLPHGPEAVVLVKSLPSGEPRTGRGS
jgi:N-acetylglutamate synthase-like GNAT family acetyltransferase